MPRSLQVFGRSRIENILLQEGLPANFSTFWSGNISASNQTNIFTSHANTATPYCYLLNKLSFSSTKDVSIYSSWNGLDPNNSLNLASLQNVNIPAGGSVSLEYQTPLPPQGLSFNLYGDSTQVGIAAKVGVTTSAIRMINDLNFDAEGKILWLGDSITDFTANAIGNSNFYQFQVRDYLSKNSTLGRTYRLTQKAAGGRTSNHFDYMLTWGSLYQEPPSFIFYQLGVNDASQAIGTTLYTSNINNFIRYKQTFWKDSILVFLGSTPVQQTARETTLATYRSAMAAAVTAANDPKVKYISLANAYDRTASPTTIWATSDNPTTNTDCLHPGTLLAHTGIANAITSGLVGQSIAF